MNEKCNFGHFQKACQKGDFCCTFQLKKLPIKMQRSNNNTKINSKSIVMFVQNIWIYAMPCWCYVCSARVARLWGEIRGDTLIIHQIEVNGDNVVTFLGSNAHAHRHPLHTEFTRWSMQHIPAQKSARWHQLFVVYCRGRWEWVVQSFERYGFIG